MRRFINCRCGKKVTTNTWKCHLRSKKCLLSEEEKASILFVLEEKTKHRFGALKSEGKEALMNFDWFMSVIEGKTKIEDWSFVQPRKVGEIRPSTAKKMSIDRVGLGNPLNKKAPIYDKDVVSKRAKEMFGDILKDENKQLNDIWFALKEEFENFQYFFTFPKIENRSKRFVLLSFLLDIPFEELEAFAIKRRGRLIKKGQQKSPLYGKIINTGRDSFRNKGRISRPHRYLYEMILSIDPDAIMEWQISFGDTWRSFDIFSPLYNCAIEMHGRVWHDIEFAKGKIEKIVKRNLTNDKEKECLIRNLRKKYTVFWDDQTDKWNEQIEEFFNATSIKYEEAKSAVDTRHPIRRRLRHRDADKQ